MDPKRELAHTLLGKARGDLEIARLLTQTATSPGWGIGFHLQQAVEKAAKSVLCASGIVYPRTHSISALLDLLAEHGLAFPFERGPLVALTPFGTLLRYDDGGPGDAVVGGQDDWPTALAAVGGVIDWAADVIGRTPG